MIMSDIQCALYRLFCTVHELWTVMPILLHRRLTRKCRCALPTNLSLYPLENDDWLTQKYLMVNVSSKFSPEVCPAQLWAYLFVLFVRGKTWGDKTVSRGPFTSITTAVVICLSILKWAIVMIHTLRMNGHQPTSWSTPTLASSHSLT